MYKYWYLDNFPRTVTPGQNPRIRVRISFRVGVRWWCKAVSPGVPVRGRGIVREVCPWFTMTYGRTVGSIKSRISRISRISVLTVANVVTLTQWTGFTPTSVCLIGLLLTTCRRGTNFHYFVKSDPVVPLLGSCRQHYRGRGPIVHFIISRIRYKNVSVFLAYKKVRKMCILGAVPHP